MEYNDGKQCGDDYIFTTVLFECGQESFDIISVDNSLYCQYTMTFGLPMHCSLLSLPIVSDKVGVKRGL